MNQARMQPDRLYYNVKMLCQKINPTDADVAAQFSQKQQDIIVHDGLDRTATPARFTLQSSNLPILIPKIQKGQNDPNLTTYAVQMTFGAPSELAYSNVHYLEYVCRSRYANSTVASPYSGQQDSPYYYMTNIIELVDMVNVALAACSAEMEGLAGTLLGPAMVYNGDNTFSIYYDPKFAVPNNVRVYFNDDLRNLFRHFNCTWALNANNGLLNWGMDVANRITNGYSPASGVNYLIEKQSYPALDCWSPVDTIQFVTSMGTQTEYVSDVQILNNQTQFGLTSNRVDNIFTDIVLPIVNPMDYNTVINYTASLYREIDLNVDTIQTVALIVNWTDKLGGVHPIMLSDGDSITMKLKFQKKSIV